MTLIGTPTGAATTNDGTYGFTNEDRIMLLYSQLGLDNILSDLTGDDVDASVNQFISDAEQTIMIRIGRYFDATDLAGNLWIASRATWIAAYYISQRAGQEHYFQGKFDEAIRELDAMATGEIPPLPDVPLKAYSYPSMSNLVVDDRFTIDKIRVQRSISVGETYPGQSIGFGVWGWF